MLSNVKWSPSGEVNFARTAVACSRWLVEFTMIESAERSATMLTISSLTSKTTSTTNSLFPQNELHSMNEQYK